jgi:hypothetical protein
MLPRLQELKIRRYGSGMSTQQSIEECWLTHGKNWNFDWMFSMLHRVPTLNCAECMKKNVMCIPIK